MQRLLMKDLVQWKRDPDRMPLVIQGVRQCGKTYLVKEFGEKYYKNTVYINFEDEPQYQAIFEADLVPSRIIKEISLRFGEVIDPDNTLIFLDEIQLCGPALTALKYFAENAPEYDIVTAGSLLGVALAEKTSFPVGKVNFLTLRPMNFAEFLLANNKNLWVQSINEGADSRFLQEDLRQYLREFYFVGGMPKAVAEWVQTGNIEKVTEIQDLILSGYEKDFAKHAPSTEYPKLTAIWHSIPNQLAKENTKFIFSQVKDSWRGKDLINALEWLIGAGLVHKVKLIEKPFIPLDAYADDSYFKLYMCDVGLLRRMGNVPPGVIFDSSPLYKEFKGAMAENYALTEIVHYYAQVYYWKSGNMAEVDFVVQDDVDIVPIEVKAEKVAHAKSITSYVNKYQPRKSIVTAMEGGNLPLYLLWTIEDWLDKKEENQ